jgi:mannose-6-phosphate isomerase-like protein (cupin superfamily)
MRVPFSGVNMPVDHEGQSPVSPFVLGPGAGRQIDGPTGQPMIVKADGGATRHAYALIQYTHAPGSAGPPAHVHHDHEEAFYVLDGELTVKVGAEIITVGPGDFALVPRGTLHQPSNRGQSPVRFFFITSPPMDGFFVAMSELLARTNGRPSAAELTDLGSRWHTDFVGLPEGPVDIRNERAGRPE